MKPKLRFLLVVICILYTFFLIQFSKPAHIISCFLILFYDFICLMMSLVAATKLPVHVHILKKITAYFMIWEYEINRRHNLLYKQNLNEKKLSGMMDDDFYCAKSRDEMMT